MTSGCVTSENSHLVSLELTVLTALRDTRNSRSFIDPKLQSVEEYVFITSVKSEGCFAGVALSE